MSNKTKCLFVTPDTHRELSLIKAGMGEDAKSFDDTIKALAKYWREGHD